MTRTDPQEFSTLLDTIAQRRSAGDGTVSAESSTHIPQVRTADVPQEVRDALQPAETGMLSSSTTPAPPRTRTLSASSPVTSHANSSGT
ncbi:hypothetical protein [Nocardia beijingensis]|uniref:hypothetical protein n=1 Tax=Nocardia beijingensis TaxID=95162 RepID=UPI000A7E9231|nr:hypothetical protein [Nocardia beijingensis]